MKIRSIYGYLFFLISCSAFGGFPAGTFVRSGDTYVAIEKLAVGDLVTCYDFATEGIENRYTEKPVLAIRKYAIDKSKLVFLVVSSMPSSVPSSVPSGMVSSGQADKIEIITVKEQKFYLPDQQTWKRAVDLRVGDCLAGVRLEKDGAQLGKKAFVIEEIILFDNSEQDSTVLNSNMLQDSAFIIGVLKNGMLYDISVKDCHNFLIQEGILVHNFAFAAPGLVFVCDSLLCLATGCELSQAILAAGVGAMSVAGGVIGNYVLSNSDNANNSDSGDNSSNNSNNSGDKNSGDNNDNNDNNKNNNGDKKPESPLTLSRLAEAASAIGGIASVCKEIKKAIRKYQKSSSRPSKSSCSSNKLSKSESCVAKQSDKQSDKQSESKQLESQSSATTMAETIASPAVQAVAQSSPVVVQSKQESEQSTINVTVTYTRAPR